MIERNPLFGLGHRWLFDTLGKDVDGCQEYDLDIVGIPGVPQHGREYLGGSIHSRNAEAHHAQSDFRFLTAVRDHSDAPAWATIE